MRAHFEQYPEALPHARPCQQTALDYSVTRALTMIPKCSGGVGKAWIDHGKDLLSFLQGTASSVSERMSKSKEAMAEMRRCNSDDTLQTKRLLLQQHNLTDWQDDRIRRSTCEQIIGYGDRRARSTIRNNAIQASVDFASLPIEEKRAMMDAASKRNAEQGREAWNQAYNSIQVWMKEKVGIPLACYNAQKNDAGPALELKNRQILDLKRYQKTLRETYEENRYNY
ncbi:MAG: hypothetical protein ACK5P7_10675 [Bdellovibrio sp.]